MWESQTGFQYRKSLTQLAPNKNLLPFLDDVDASLKRKAEATIADAQHISLVKAVKAGEKTKQNEQDWEEKHMLALRKRTLEEQLTGHWKSEGITGVIEMLEMCDCPQMVNDVYSGGIPDNVLQLAELHISVEKQKQLMAWRFTKPN